MGSLHCDTELGSCLHLLWSLLFLSEKYCEWIICKYGQTLIMFTTYLPICIPNEKLSHVGHGKMSPLFEAYLARELKVCKVPESIPKKMSVQLAAECHPQ